MSGWAIPNAARSRKAGDKAQRLAECLAVSRCLKEAAWRAGIPVRTANRLRARLG
jgi:hypothetical protein